MYEPKISLRSTPLASVENRLYSREPSNYDPYQTTSASKYQPLPSSGLKPPSNRLYPPENNYTPTPAVPADILLRRSQNPRTLSTQLHPSALPSSLGQGPSEPQPNISTFRPNALSKQDELLRKLDLYEQKYQVDARGQGSYAYEGRRRQQQVFTSRQLKENTRQEQNFANESFSGLKDPSGYRYREIPVAPALSQAYSAKTPNKSSLRSSLANQYEGLRESVGLEKGDLESKYGYNRYQLENEPLTRNPQYTRREPPQVQDQPFRNPDEQRYYARTKEADQYATRRQSYGGGVQNYSVNLTRPESAYKPQSREVDRRYEPKYQREPEAPSDREQSYKRGLQYDQPSGLERNIREEAEAPIRKSDEASDFEKYYQERSAKKQSLRERSENLKLKMNEPSPVKNLQSRQVSESLEQSYSTEKYRSSQPPVASGVTTPRGVTASMESRWTGRNNQVQQQQQETTQYHRPYGAHVSNQSTTVQHLTSRQEAQAKKDRVQEEYKAEGARGSVGGKGQSEEETYRKIETINELNNKINERIRHILSSFSSDL